MFVFIIARSPRCASGMRCGAGRLAVGYQGASGEGTSSASKFIFLLCQQSRVRRLVDPRSRVHARKVLAQLSRSLQMAAESDWAAEIAAMQSESSRVAVDAVDASVAAAAESAAAAAVAEAQLSEADLSLVRAFSALPDVSSDAAREISEQVESTTGYPLL